MRNTFATHRVPVPDSRVVRLPDGYPHEFASTPSRWREITVGPTARVVEYPTLDPATDARLRRHAIGPPDA